MKPGARPPLNDAYFRRMSAIEFAVKYDDGVGSGLADADIVLVGVSRTSKTPLSIYLGYLGYKTANVPLVKGIEPPAELFTIDQSKVVGLTIDAQRLSEIRGERIRWMRGDRKYASLVEIYDELEYAAQMHRRLGCPVLEVSELSIEEISHRIIQLVERRRAEAAADARMKPKPPSRSGAGPSGTPRSAPRSSSSTASSRRSGSACGRSPGWPSSARAAAARVDSRAGWRIATSTTSTSRRPGGVSCSAARGSGSRR